jgi:hypothetical protein
MADAKKDDKKDSAPDPAAAAKKHKLFAAGGFVAVLALAFGAALMAVPKKVAKPELAGPYVAPLSPSKLQVNLNDGRSYLVLNLNLLFEAYAADYVTLRTTDAVCNAEVRDQLVAISSAKSRQDVSDKVLKPVYLEEIRHAVEPLLFPVHIGFGDQPTAADPASKLAPGITTSTFRGLFEDHVLKVDNVSKTIALDDGAPVTFKGDERDLAVGAEGSVVYLDVTALEPEFRGDVKVGVKGLVKRVLWDEVLIQ